MTSTSNGEVNGLRATGGRGRGLIEEEFRGGRALRKNTEPLSELSRDSIRARNEWNRRRKKEVKKSPAARINWTC